LGYSLQANRKTREGDSHPDRNAQFEYIGGKVRHYIALHQPVISVDTKKKEWVGDFKNGGREWRPKGNPEKVRVHDFVIPELGRAAPYGVYDLADNTGWVSVGVDQDTASFAVETIRRWWCAMGQEKYPRAEKLLITADGGGRNGSRVRLWKLELQRLADETGLALAVSHFPPGTSKWNKIEHRLFSFISKNWRGQPLTSLKVIVNLIAGTTTKKGLKVHAEIDGRNYPAGVKVPDSEMAAIKLRREAFHGEWNYEILPRK
ncbi:MAG: ISAzo13 family transposase, partial [Acidobacteria bacterium]